MSPADRLSKSPPAETDVSRIRNIAVVCRSCGEEVRVRISERTLHGVPQVCLNCQVSFAGEREWLIASLEALGEAAKYTALLQNSSIVVRAEP
jgi:hypothetical protein